MTNYLGVGVVLLSCLFSIIPENVNATPLVGYEGCEKGPTQWCQNITTAHSCGAVKFCIQTVWEKQEVKNDYDSVCQICVDMVKQARDQLESNETQADLKAVFEGSCKLIPVNIISKECIALVDQFIPDLVETLASQMNPQAVCTVAGLCNNKRIDQILSDHDVAWHLENLKVERTKCQHCGVAVSKLKENFVQVGYEGFLHGMLATCGHFGSLSDGCSSLVFRYFEDIFSFVDKHVNPRGVCLVTACAMIPKTEIAVADLAQRFDGTKDEVCDFCQQMVLHLKDILVANTSKVEFKQLLTGMCGQSGTFKGECLELVDQYYSVFYDYLVNELDSKMICSLAGICPKDKYINLDGPIAPLLSQEASEIAVRVIQKAESLEKSKAAANNKHKLNVQIMNPIDAQLPVDRMFVAMPENKELCTFCQYFLHYLQVTISDAQSEEKIKEAVEKACDILPNTVEAQCKSFVEQYGDAVIALLIQEIDPTQVCPALTLCSQHQVTNVEILMNSGNDDKPNCPLCLFAVQQLESMLVNNKTEANVKNALDQLCSHLPTKLKPECIDFVDTYSKQLVEMLIADFTPQEVCVYLKLCADNKPNVQSLHKSNAFENFFNSNPKPVDLNRHRNNSSTFSDKQIETNEIPDHTVNGKPLVYVSIDKKVEGDQGCEFCEFVMTQIENQLKDKKNEDEIKHAVLNICKILPKKYDAKCQKFVEEYADTVIALLIDELSPKDVCTAISLCPSQQKRLKNSVIECAVCEETVDMVEQLLKNPKIDRDIEHLSEKACYALPARYLDRCLKFMKIYGQSILNLIATFEDGRAVCTKLNICSNNFAHVELITNEDEPKKVLVGAEKCTWGPSYWCEYEEHAQECGAMDHCNEHVWKGEVPRKSKRDTPLLGAKKCTWGPSYWCEYEEQAQECGAVDHCKEHVWKGEAPRKTKRDTHLLGAKKCTWGPSYWCENEDQAKECRAIDHCKERVWKGEAPPKAKREVPLIDSMKCSWGATYWCENEDQAKQCGKTEHCKENVWKGEAPTRAKRSTQLGEKRCTWGPSYWCESVEQAKECGATNHCVERVWKGPQPSNNV